LVPELGTGGSADAPSGDAWVGWSRSSNSNPLIKSPLIALSPYAT
jgi:hypothetical protein